MRPLFGLATAIITILLSCSQKKENTIQVLEYQDTIHPVQPKWARDAVLYELNVRQFSEAGTLKAVRAELPRLKKTGVDVIWLMPIFPIGEKNRKGGLGSPYSVRDYKAVNPDYGTEADLKSLVEKAHNLDMKIILDWVPNHTAWDHVWLEKHPDFFTKYKGEFTVPLNEHGEPIEDWSDVMDLDYSNPDMRQAMIDALKYWVEKCDIDGYRFDMAGLVPNEFWKEVRPQLDTMKHLYMLAEWQDEREHFNSAFQFNYGWKFKDVTKEIAAGKKDALALWDLKMELDSFYPKHYCQVLFTTNHDENTWNGNDKTLYSDAWEAMTVLTYTWGGMPMFYNGQESGLEQQLAFFEKEVVEWKEYKNAEFYKKLHDLRTSNSALQNQPYGGKLENLSPYNETNILAFSRKNHNNKNLVVVIINLSNEERIFKIRIDELRNNVKRAFHKNFADFKNSDHFEIPLAPWEYRIITSNN